MELILSNPKKERLFGLNSYFVFSTILHSTKGRESEARSHLGSPLGELCNIVLVYGKLRFCVRGFSEGKSDVTKRATTFV